MGKQRVISPLAQLIWQIQSHNGSVSAFDPQLAAAVKQALLGKSDLDRAFQTATGEAKIGFDEARQQLQKQKIESYANNDQYFSGNGLLRSGIYANQQGKVGTAYQDGLTQAAQRRQQMIGQATDARLSGYNQLQGMLEGAQGDSARRAQQDAQEAAQRAIQAQQAQQMAAIQQQALASQQSIAQQQLDFYRNAIAQSGTGSSGGYPTTPQAPNKGNTGSYGGLNYRGPGVIYRRMENY